MPAPGCGQERCSRWCKSDAKPSRFLHELCGDSDSGGVSSSCSPDGSGAFAYFESLRGLGTLLVQCVFPRVRSVSSREAGTVSPRPVPLPSTSCTYKQYLSDESENPVYQGLGHLGPGQLSVLADCAGKASELLVPVPKAGRWRPWSGC